MTRSPIPGSASPTPSRVIDGASSESVPDWRLSEAEVTSTVTSGTVTVPAAGFTLRPGMVAVASWIVNDGGR